MRKVSNNFIESDIYDLLILVTRASDLMAAHDPQDSSLRQSCAKEKSSGVEIDTCEEVTTPISRLFQSQLEEEILSKV